MIHGESEQDMASLWIAYKEYHAKDVRDRLVEHYLPLVNIIAGRIAISLPSHVDRDDLISSGFFGLMRWNDMITRGKINLKPMRGFASAAPCWIIYGRKIGCRHRFDKRSVHTKRP